MNLLLTSAGISNKSIEKVFLELIEKPAKDTKIAFIPTAANFYDGDKSWIDLDILKLKKMGFSVEIIDLDKIGNKNLAEIFERFNVLFFEGGSDLYLMDRIVQSGLIKIIRKLLETKLWVGISAGSMVVGNKLLLKVDEALYGEGTGEYKDTDALKLVDFDVLPHFNSTEFKPGVTLTNINKIINIFKGSVYTIDDDTAIKIIDGKIEIISEGKWKKLK